MSRNLLKQCLDLLIDGAEPEATLEKAIVGMCAHWDVDALALIKAIEKELAKPDPEPVAWMYPSTLKDFEHGEKADYAYSIQMGNMKTGEETVPLYELDEVKHDL